MIAARAFPGAARIVEHRADLSVQAGRCSKIRAQLLPRRREAGCDETAGHRVGIGGDQNRVVPEFPFLGDGGIGAHNHTRRFNPELALAIETRSRQTVHVHKVVDAEGGEARLYCYSEAAGEKGAGHRKPLRGRVEGAPRRPVSAAHPQEARPGLAAHRPDQGEEPRRRSALRHQRHRRRKRREGARRQHTGRGRRSARSPSRRARRRTLRGRGGGTTACPPPGGTCHVPRHAPAARPHSPILRRPLPQQQSESQDDKICCRRRGAHIDPAAREIRRRNSPTAPPPI